MGVIDNPPFTKITSDSFSGKEITIINNFAASQNLEVIYFKDTESHLIEKLEKYEIDLIVGGFDKKTVWSKIVGVTKSYDKKHVILLPKGENKLLIKLEEYIHQNVKNEKF